MKNEQTYAVFSTGGKQYRVSEGDKLAVELLDTEIGKKVTFDSVLLVNSNGKVSVGNPTIAGAEISATLEEEFRGDKVKVFKKKRRKGFRKLTGHRQNYHMLTIDSISLAGKATKGKKAAKAEKPEAAAEKPAVEDKE
jgi:large subunit ribosomal protein L21